MLLLKTLLVIFYILIFILFLSGPVFFFLYENFFKGEEDKENSKQNIGK